MSRVVKAVYEKGVLELLGKTGLWNGNRVRVIILKSSHGLDKIIKKLSSEYSDVKNDPLKNFLKERR